MTAAIATVVENAVDFMSGGPIPLERRLARLEDAYRVLTAANHDEGLGYYWWSLAGEKWVSLQAAETAAACERGLDHFRRARMLRRTDDLVWQIRSAYVLGPTPVPEAIERVRALHIEAGDSMQLQAGAATTLARLLAMQGDFEQARELYAFGRDFYRSAGMTVSAAGVTQHGAWIEQRAGDIAAWEKLVRSGFDELQALGNRAFMSTTAVWLAHCLYFQGRYHEVRELCAIVREQSPADDIVNFVYADALEGCLLAHEGRHENAEAQIRSALARIETGDFFFATSAIRLFHAETQFLAGDSVAAALSAAMGLEVLDSKGDVTGAARERERLADLGIEVA